MGTVPAPDIFHDAESIAQAPANALEEYQRVAALKQQTAFEQQQTDIAQQQAQQQQIATQEMQKQRQLAPQFLQKDDNGKITGFDNEGYYNALIGSGMNPASVMAMRQKNLDYQKGITQLNSDQLALHEKVNDQAYQTVDPLRQLANGDPKDFDLNRLNQTWQSVAPKLLQLGIDPKTMPASFQSQQDAAQRLQDFEIELGQHKQMLADQKTQAETSEAQQKGQQAGAEAQAARFKEMNGGIYDVSGQQPKLVTPQGNSPDQWNSLVDQVAPVDSNRGLNMRTKAAVGFYLQQGNLKAAQDEITRAGQQVGAIEKDVAVATNPQVQQGKEQVAAAEGASKAATEINTKRQETSDAQYQSAMGADERLNRMEKSYTDAVDNHNQQAMLALLTDHIGMTLGLQKGARITKDIINEAAKSQPWIAGLRAKFDSDGYLSGVNLSPGQMKQMLDLGYSARENAWDNARQTSQLYGVKEPPNATAVYSRRDPNARVYNATPSPGAGFSVKAPNGKTYTFKDQQSLDNFKKSAGIQ